MPKYLYVPVVKSVAADDGFLKNVVMGWKDSYVSRFRNEGLADVGDDERLYIVGHGALADTSLQTCAPEELFKILKAEKLPRTHIRFSLFSCYSGVATMGQSHCFAQAFAEEIKGHYTRAIVDGYLGLVSFKRDLQQPKQPAIQKEVTPDHRVYNGNEVRGATERAKGNYVQFLVNAGRVKAISGADFILHETTEPSPYAGDWQKVSVHKPIQRPN